MAVISYYLVLVATGSYYPALAFSLSSLPTPLTLRTFYEAAIHTGVIVNPVEMFVAYTTQLLGYLCALMLRVLVIAAILMPFFGLIRHARRKPSVGEVSATGACSGGLGIGPNTCQRRSVRKQASMM